MFQNELNNQLIDAQEKSMETMKHLAQVAIASAQAITEINSELAHEASTVAQDKVTQLMTIKDPGQMINIAQPESCQAVAQHIGVYQTRVHQVLRKANKEFTEVIDDAINNSKSVLVTNIEKMKKQAPAGSEALVSAWKMVFEVSMQQFDQIRSINSSALRGIEKCFETTFANAQEQDAPIQSATKTRKAKLLHS